MRDAASSNLAFGTVTTQASANACTAITSDVSGSYSRRVKKLLPFDGDPFLGGFIVCLGGEVALTLGTIQSAYRNQLVHCAPYSFEVIQE
ncbi:MAG TPA: hypothetical protein VII92_06260 [Anaerolineae bacterium]